MVDIDRFREIVEEVGRLQDAVAGEINAYQLYIKTPRDRGGVSGPKSRAKIEWMEARARVVLALVGRP